MKRRREEDAKKGGGGGGEKLGSDRRRRRPKYPQNRAVPRRKNQISEIEKNGQKKTFPSHTRERDHPIAGGKGVSKDAIGEAMGGPHGDTNTRVPRATSTRTDEKGGGGDRAFDDEKDRRDEETKDGCAVR